MIVAGRVSQKMAPVLRQIYDQMTEPKWVISMGACASTGGVFNNYALVQGVDQIVPVDIYVPGCPPRPEMLIDGIMLLHETIKRGEYTAREGHRVTAIETQLGSRRPSGSSGRERFTDRGLAARRPLRAWTACTSGSSDRFEIVVQLAQLSDARNAGRSTSRPTASRPTVPSVVEVWPSANFMEREAFDLFGILFEGHPDLTRILMPDEWEGHPLRKDYGVGKVAIEFMPAAVPADRARPGQAPNVEASRRRVDQLGQAGRTDEERSA